MDEEIKTPETPETPEKKDLGDKLEDFRDKAAEKLDDIGDKIEDKFDDLKEKFNEKKEEAQPKIDEAKEKIKDAMDTPDTTSEYDEADIKANKIQAILAYCGILLLIPLLAAKDSKFARFHLNQGIMVLILCVIAYIFQRARLGFIAWIIDIAALIFAIIGIINAAGGKAKELPLIGKFRILK
ncbi:MAG: hypothetical protein J5699_01535 [Bacteroidales bacterium]|nr:hypothetical protein [Bacteroidales bacterium]